MTSRPIALIAALIFLCMALVHVYRLFTHFRVILGSHTIPLWVSYFGAVIPALIAILLLRESRSA